MRRSARRGSVRRGIIGNHVRSVNGTAAVSTDVRIRAKASHWRNPRRQIRQAREVLSLMCKSEDLLGLEALRDGNPSGARYGNRRL